MHVYLHYGANGTETSPIVIENCSFAGEATSGAVKALGITTVYGNIKYVEVKNNTFDNLSYGMYFNQVNNLTATANAITNTRYNGINVAADSESYPCSNITITGNVMSGIASANYDYDEYASGIRIGLYVSNVTVADNSISMLNDRKEIYYDAEAKVGNNYYETLNAALNAVADSGEVTLLKDAELKANMSIQYITNKDWTIDLDGHVINNTCSNGIWLYTDHNLTFKNGSVTGTIPFVSVFSDSSVTLINMTNAENLADDMGGVITIE